MDRFFNQKNCDRCGKKLIARIMSWFTNETICMSCSVAEDELKEKLRQQGKPVVEGCGYVPKV